MKQSKDIPSYIYTYNEFHIMIIWNKHQVFSATADTFLKEIQAEFSNSTSGA